jgi:hypothetical protein
MADNPQQRIYELLAREAPEGERDSFSHFDSADSRRGSEVASELSRIGASEGADAAIARAYEVADDESLGVAKYALKLFVTHDNDSARELTIPSPEIGESEPLPPAEEGRITGEPERHDEEGEVET